MKGFLKVLVVILMLAGIGGTIYFYVNYTQVSKEKEMYVQENAQLQSSIDAIGAVTTVYTVVSDMSCGTVITENDFQEITIPVSAVTDQTIINTSDVVGYLYKVDVHPGTIMTADLVMSNEFDETAYEQDMVFDFLPLGLSIGDYVDIKMTLPYGQTFIVIQHKRVENVVTDSNVIKVYLTPAQQILWESAMKDAALYGDSGLSLYVTKYVEPGIQDETYANYPIRQEMESIANLDNNITDKSEVINHSLRVAIDALLAAVDEDEASDLAGGVSSEASGINNAVSSFVENTDNASSVAGSSEEEGETIDLGSYEESVTDNLQEIDGTLSEYEYD